VSAARVRLGAVAALLAAVAAGCGTPSPDLFVVHRSGSVPGAKLDLLVSDTTVRCNLGAARPLSSAQTLEARDITKDLLELQRGKTALPPAPPAQIFRFAVRSEAGTLRYGDTTQRPSVLPRLSRFTRDVAVGLCGLQR
jgi:hypothetical protein